jgi:hypothetical protein
VKSKPDIHSNRGFVTSFFQNLHLKPNLTFAFGCRPLIQLDYGRPWT